jgi:hypothetical protein
MYTARKLINLGTGAAAVCTEEPTRRTPVVAVAARSTAAAAVQQPVPRKIHRLKTMHEDLEKAA